MTQLERPVFDADEWGLLRRATCAMSAGDTLAFSEDFRIMSERGGYPDRCLIYVHYALQYQSAKLTQMDPPTHDALQQIAAEVGPRYESYVQPT